MKVLSSYHHVLLRTAAALTGIALVSACASVPPPPTAALQSAQRAIDSAEQADAGHYASADLAEARSNLLSANSAVAEQHMTLGERLANESRTEAELASARTAYVKARAVNDDMKNSNGTIIQEMQRSAGDKP